MSQVAYIYARWSTADQGKGHSPQRQHEDGKAFIERMGWDYSPDRVIIDDGRSAYHGANREEGAGLYDFEEKAKAGHFNNGAVLVVENIDRLTRQGWEQATDLLRTLTVNGVTVATWHGGEVFKAFERIDMGRVMLLIAKAELAWEESYKKSKRLKAAWVKKREVALASGKALTRTVPGWLEVDDTGTIVPVPHRVAVLNEIYDWYCQGKGLPWIERELNQRKEPTWGRGKYANNPSGWINSTIHKMLTSRTVLGELETKVRALNGKGKVPSGTIIPNYYPQAITPDKFNRVQAVMSQRKKWGGKQQFNLPNLFSGIAECGECMGRMNMVAQRKAGQVRTERQRGKLKTWTVKTPRSYLRCNNHARGHKCGNKTRIRYEFLEAAVLRHLFELAMRGAVIKPSSKAQTLVSTIAEHERQLSFKHQQLDRITDNLMEVHSRALAQKAAELEGEIEADQTDLEQLRRDLELERGTSKPEEDLQALIDARSALHSDDPELRYAARVKTHQALHGLFKAMECRADGTTAIVIGDYAVGMTFDNGGNCIDGSILPTARIHGPNGEPDWHPDAEAAESASLFSTTLMRYDLSVEGDWPWQSYSR